MTTPSFTLKRDFMRRCLIAGASLAFADSAHMMAARV